jgi:tetratricopeptide (TPR) repeat protein
MRSGLRRRLLLFALISSLIPICSGATAASKSNPSLGSWLARKACSIQERPSAAEATIEGCPGLDAFVARGREIVTGSSGAADTIDRLNVYFFQAEGFQATHDLSSSEHLLPGPVLAGKKGYCVGLATIYLILAKELNLPVHAVAAPQHVFLRWDDGSFRRNIELFQEGRPVLDKDYTDNQKIPQESIDDGVFLVNLTDKQFLGLIYQNLGVLGSQQGKFEESGKDYARAIHLNPKLAAAFYNRGNDELKQKQYREAVRDYTKSLELYPTDAWALWNRGLAWEGLGEPENEKKDKARARDLAPTFTPPR